MNIIYFIKGGILLIAAIYLYTVNINKTAKKKKTYKSDDNTTFTAFDESKNKISHSEAIKLLNYENLNSIIDDNGQSVPGSQTNDRKRQQ